MDRQPSIKVDYHSFFVGNSGVDTLQVPAFSLAVKNKSGKLNRSSPPEKNVFGEY